MANPYTIFKTNPKLETEGVIVDYGEFRVKIARAGGSNKKFTNLLQARLKPFKRQMETETMDNDVARKVLIECYVEAIILDMDVKQDDGKYVSGILKADGSSVEFTRENAIQFFLDLPELFSDIQEQAKSIALFRAAELDGVIKNS